MRAESRSREKAALFALLLVGCGSGEEVTVFAAASLRDALTDAAEVYESSHEGVEIVISTGGSQVLRRQVEAGAPANVFAPASPAHVEAPSIAAQLEAPRVLTCNDLVLAVERGSSVRRLDDLPDAQRLVLGVPEVPVGAYADTLIERGAEHFGESWARGVRHAVVSREIDARQVLAKVTLGEADAALVYRSDARAARGSIRMIEVPAELGVTAVYPIAIVRGASAPARGFSDWLVSPGGQALLARHGFASCAHP